MPEPTEDFREIIERSQRVSGDLGGLFSNPSRVAFEPRRAQPGPEANYIATVNVFTLPTDNASYEDVLNMIMRGEAVLRYEDRAFNKEGDYQVAICYLTPRVPAPAPNAQEAGDAEDIVRPQKLP